MDDDEKEVPQDGQSTNAQGPGLQFLLYQQCEDLVEKLKLLDYESEYVKLSASHKPISRHYFVSSTNIGEQFFLFITLCGWLIQKSVNSDFAIPQEFDDPNATISNILSELRKKQVEVNFAPNKLKHGFGEQCIYVLDQLADLALVESGFIWTRAQPVAEDDEEVDAGADEAEITAEQFDDDEENVAAAEDDDNGILLDLQRAPIPGVDGNDQGERPLEKILLSETDANAWKLEVERIAPQLKVTIRQDSKDWRAHLEQMHSFRTALKELLSTAQPHLDTLTEDLEKGLERINTREKHLNGQLEAFLHQLRQSQDKIAEAKERYKEASSGITERTQKLQQVSEEIDQVKRQIDEQGQRHNDGAPMVRIKQALAKLQTDITTMDVQIGVIEQSLLQYQLKDRVAYATDGYTA